MREGQRYSHGSCISIRVSSTDHTIFRRPHTTKHLIDIISVAINATNEPLDGYILTFDGKEQWPSTLIFGNCCQEAYVCMYA